MARRRMISQELLIDEDFNSLSIEAQNVFVRFLSVSDDFGFVPANLYTLDKLINTPRGIDLPKCLESILKLKLGAMLKYDGREFFVFKRERFDDYQSYLIQKRTKSEYLHLTKDEILSENFQELLRNSFGNGCSSIESIKYKAESKKQKVEREQPALDLNGAFEKLWKEYPRREGKKEALKHFNATIKSEDDLKHIQVAIENYIKHLNLAQTEPQFIKTGSTWFNNWSDWIEPTKEMMGGYSNGTHNIDITKPITKAQHDILMGGGHYKTSDFEAFEIVNNEVKTFKLKSGERA